MNWSSPEVLRCLDDNGVNHLLVAPGEKEVHIQGFEREVELIISLILTSLLIANFQPFGATSKHLIFTGISPPPPQLKNPV